MIPVWTGDPVIVAAKAEAQDPIFVDVASPRTAD